MTSAEFGTSNVGIREIVFGDLGWAGSRTDFSHPGRPLSGAGIGASFMDGLVRIDSPRGSIRRNPCAPISTSRRASSLRVSFAFSAWVEVRYPLRRLARLTGAESRTTQCAENYSSAMNGYW